MAENEISIAVRAYAVAHQALEPFPETGGAVPRHGWVRTASQTLTTASRAIERFAASMDLRWRTKPLDRFLSTQLGLLQDALAYIGSRALGGYGFLDGATGAYVDTWCRSVSAVLDVLAQAIARQEPDLTTDKNLAVEENHGFKGSLTVHQQVAVNGFLEAFARDLLLLKAYAMVAFPPVYPAFVSPYDGRSAGQILAHEHVVEIYLAAMGQALGVSIPWTEAGADIVVQCTHRAEESLQQILHIARQLDEGRRREIAVLYRTAHQAYQVTLNLAL